VVRRVSLDPFHGFSFRGVGSTVVAGPVAKG
jgi:hypothetical protein